MAEGVCIGGYKTFEIAERWSGDRCQTTAFETVGIGQPPNARLNGHEEALDPDVCAIEAWTAVPPASGATHARTCCVSGCGRILECRVSTS